MSEMNVNRGPTTFPVGIKTIGIFVLIVIIALAFVSTIKSDSSLTTFNSESTFDESNINPNTNSEKVVNTEVVSQKDFVLEEEYIPHTNSYVVINRFVGNIDIKEGSIIDIPINKNGLSYIHIETKKVNTEMYGRTLMTYITIVCENEKVVENVELTFLNYDENDIQRSVGETFIGVNEEFEVRIREDLNLDATRITLRWRYNLYNDK